GRGPRRGRPAHPRESAPRRPVPLRRDPRRVRADRRLQLPLGVVHGARGGGGRGRRAAARCRILTPFRAVLYVPTFPGPVTPHPTKRKRWRNPWSASSWAPAPIGRPCDTP